MKTRVQIVQALLDERKITAEDAVVLLMTEKEYVYVNWGTYPVFPQPYQPIWQVFPDHPTTYEVYCTSQN